VPRGPRAARRGGAMPSQVAAPQATATRAREAPPIAAMGPRATTRYAAVMKPAEVEGPRALRRRSSAGRPRASASPLPPRPSVAAARALTGAQATASPSTGLRAPPHRSGMGAPEAAAGSAALALRSAPHGSSCPPAVLGQRARRCTAPRWSRSPRSSTVARAPTTGSGRPRSRTRTSGRLLRRSGGRGRGASAHPVRTPLASSERRRCCTSRDLWRSSPSSDRGRRRSWTAPQPPRI